ncbi:hypothetical protein H311_00929, partial [Anncaliia algerae PRA109]
TINNIISRFKNGESFIDADQKRHTTCETKNMPFKDSKQAMINAIAIKNSLTLKEAASVVAELHIIYFLHQSPVEYLKNVILRGKNLL